MPPKKTTVSKPRPSIKRPREPQVQELPWEMRDEAMRRRYSVLAKRPIICTRYLDEPDSGAIVVGGIVSMIALRLRVQLESPIHTRILGNDRLDLNTLVLMKLCRREGGRYLIINEEGTFVSRPPQVVEEHIPMPTAGASTSRPRTIPQAAPDPSQPPQMPEERPPTTAPVTLEMIMAAIHNTNAKLDSIVNEVREYHETMSLKLASIENQLHMLNVNRDEDFDTNSDND
ncbi:hypothetical protein ACLOJK_036582 [Asimina triloba]